MKRERERGDAGERANGAGGPAEIPPDAGEEPMLERIDARTEQAVQLLRLVLALLTPKQAEGYSLEELLAALIKQQQEIIRTLKATQASVAEVLEWLPPGLPT